MKPGLKFYDLGQGEEDRGQYDKFDIIAPGGAAGLFRLNLLKKIKEKDAYFDPEFFMYKDSETMEIAVVYKRKDGNYGVLESE